MRLAEHRGVLAANSTRMSDLSLAAALKLISTHEQKTQPSVGRGRKPPKAWGRRSTGDSVAGVE